MSSNTTDAVSLHHVIVVGGTLADWADMSDEQWNARLAELGKVADHVGAEWLIVRPFEVGPAGIGAVVADRADRSVTVGNCLAVAQPDGDGRQRLTQAVAALQAAGEPIDQASIDSALNAPADVDPDLVVVVGAGHRLPPSLVWELAYSELVFVDTTWRHFGPSQLDEAIGSYAHRQRRFGGID